MSESRKPFPFSQFEPKWQSRWDAEQTFRTPNPGEASFDASKPKYYVLDMFPYPSGSGLHVGHPEGYTATDIIGRYKRMNGFNVLHPMGYDSFGLPAEQYAIKTGQHPAITTAANIENFRRQLKSLGFAYDWSREIATTDPEYVRWTQWIFLQIYNSYFCEETNRARPISELEAKGWTREQIDAERLAFVADTPVWWSPDLGTVLANEEVEEWKSKGHTVERRPLRQWMLRITKYAQRLIDELDTLDWPEGIKLLQKNWIGRSEGAEVKFQVSPQLRAGSVAPIGAVVYGPTELGEITVYTTRPDTLFGASYIVLAPEHPIVQYLCPTQWPSDTPDNWKGDNVPARCHPHNAVSAYRQSIVAKSDLERGELNKDKTGVFTGAYAINPVNGEEIPIWIADYVMMGYGTGSIMAVPAHDERDYEFAVKFKLPIKQVVAPVNSDLKVMTDAIAAGIIPAEKSQIRIITEAKFDEGSQSYSSEGQYSAFSEHGMAINSGFLDGLPTAKAKAAIIDWLVSNNQGKRKIQYKLRDWLFSRQRYWGEPFPIIWKDGQHYALPDDQLPLLAPPLDDYKPSGTPDPLLSKATEWVNLPDGYTRETNTMPQWAGSCWYYLRYCDPNNSSRFISTDAESYWSSSDQQSTINNQQSSIHSRTGMVDLYVGGTEHAVLHLLYARFWHKVLFDLGHVSTPEPFQRLVNQGLILGEDGQKMSKSRGNVVNPDDVVKEYGADSLRLYEMFMGPLEQVKPWQMKGVEGVSRFLARVWRLAITDEGEVSDKVVSEACTDKELSRVVHETIKKVGEDIEKLSFNTAISQMMICTNAFTQAGKVPVKEFIQFLTVLNPFAPHLSEEINERVAKAFKLPAAQLSESAWPAYDEQALVRTECELVVQVNGKLRDRIWMAMDASEDDAKALAFASDKIKEFTDGKELRKVIYVPGKIMNLVVG